MLSKLFTAPIFLLVLTSSVNAAGVVVAPALGVSAPTSANVLHPSTSDPCAGVNIANNIDNSTPVAPNSGIYTVSVTNFGTGSDNSRFIKSVKVNAKGDGVTWVDAQVVANGVQAPTTDGTDKVTCKLPDGVQCTGGKNKNLCVVSFITEKNDGNCAVFKA